MLFHQFQELTFAYIVFCKGQIIYFQIMLSAKTLPNKFQMVLTSQTQFCQNTYKIVLEITIKYL